MGMNLKLSSSASGTRNQTGSFNPTVVASETHVLGMDPSDPTLYHVPGNGLPAVSTSAYYNAHGMYGFRCYDLDTWGSAGVAAKAANGGYRYVWPWSGDHPVTSFGWRGGTGFFVGFSDQPWNFPKTWHEVIQVGNNTGSTIFGGSGYQTYEYPHLFYNPDDTDGLPIYLFAEAGPDHYTALWRSADLLTFAYKDLAMFHTPTGTWNSFLTNVKRLGAGSFRGTALSNGPAPKMSIYTSTDGRSFTTTGTAISGMEGSADAAGSIFLIRNMIQIGALVYGVGREDASGGGNNQYGVIVPLDPTTFDRIGTTKTRIASGWSNAGFPGPTFLNECHSYEEDGILYAWPTYGFPSDVSSTALGNGRGGAPYLYGGGLDHQFVDRLAIRFDDTAARQSAPVGVAVSCVSGTATISWKDALPQNTYRVYRGTTLATQATLVGDVTGTSTTDAPSTGRYWYKVVTLDSGTERKSRIVSVYVSTGTAFVNQHIDRVLEDGGDSTTINLPFLTRADTMLDSVGIRSTLELFTHPAAGVKTSTSPIKIYDIGTTRLPRSEDFKPTTASTTYSSSAVNTGPGWTNANNNSYGYWGNSKLGNTIQRKRQISIIVAYERSQTTEDFTFVGTGPIWGALSNGSAIISLKHVAGTPGSIEFALSDATSTKTASVTASGSGLQIAIGTYDGTNMLAYTGTTAGSAVSTLDPNPEFGALTAQNVPGFVEGALAGSRLNNSQGSTPNDVITVGGFGNKYIYPILGSGSVHCNVLRAYTGSDDMRFNETNAKGKIQCVMILEKAVTALQIADIVTFLQSTANW